MSGTSSTPPQSITGGPSIGLRICAIGVILALAGLAAYTVFSGPTEVPVRIPSTAPTRVAPPAAEPDSEGQGER